MENQSIYNGLSYLIADEKTRSDTIVPVTTRRDHPPDYTSV